MKENENLMSINIEDSLNRHPEFKLLTNYTKIYSKENLFDDNNKNFDQSCILQFIFENEEIFSGEEFNDILNFSIYNYLIQFENKNSKEIFFQIFKNLKVYFAMNINKNEQPLFFYNCVYKSLVYMNKLIVDTQKFFKKENYSLLLIEILEFMPNLFNALKLSKSKDLFREDAINQIEIMYNLLNSVNTVYNNSNKSAIAFYLLNMNPFLANENKSRRITNFVEQENLIEKNNFYFTFSKDSERRVQKISQSANLNFDTFISNPRINMNNNSINFNQITANVLNNTSSFLTDISSNFINNNNNILNDSVCEEDENSISNSIDKIKQDKSDKKENAFHNKEIKLYSNENYYKNNKKPTDDNQKIFHNQNFNLFQKLSSKVKKFTENHFERQTFRLKFLSSFNIQDRDIHSMLETVARNFFQEVNSFFNLERTNLEFDKLKTEFSNIFKNYSLHLIGSLSQEVYSNLRERTSIDFVLLPDIKNQSDKFFTNINEFIESIIINQMENYTIQFNQEENKEILKDFNATMTIYSKNYEKYFNANILIHKEKLIFSNNYFSKIFLNCENLKILHIFLQEILITKIGFCCTRWDLTITILSFLDFYLGFLNKIEKKFVTFDSLYPEDLENYQTSNLIENKESFFYFEFSEVTLEVVNKIPLGELILEFLRYFLNYMTWFKNIYNKNKIKCNGFEKLQKIFENEFFRDKKYLFYHEYLDGFCILSQEEFIKEFISRYGKFEEIFFIICENSKIIKRYSEIISNIKEIHEEK